MIRRFLLIATLILFTVGIAVAVPPDESRPKDGAMKVLIVTDNSDFKKRVVKKLLEYSKDTEVEYTIIDITKASSSNTADYDGYVFLCKLIGGKVERKTNALYQTLNGKNILIGLTLGFDGPLPENAKRDIGSIDAITSASAKKNVDGFATKIYDWVIRAKSK